MVGFNAAQTSSMRGPPMRWQWCYCAVLLLVGVGAAGGTINADLSKEGRARTASVHLPTLFIMLPTPPHPSLAMISLLLGSQLADV